MQTGQDWLQRVDRADDPELERLVVEMQKRAELEKPCTPELASALCLASARLLTADPGTLTLVPDLEARAEQARLLARRFGGPDERVRVENELAKACKALGDNERARRVLLDAREHEREGLALLPETYLLLADEADARGELAEAERWSAGCAELLEQARARDREDPRWLSAHLEFEALRLGADAARSMKLGLPDRALLAIERENEVVAKVREQDPGTYLVIHAARIEALLGITCQDFERTLRCIERAQASGVPMENSEQQELALYRALALSEEAREGHGDLPGVEPLLRALIDERATLPGVRIDARLCRIDLCLRLRRWEDAQHELEVLSAELALPPGASASPANEQARTRAAAYAVRLALETHAPAEALRARRDELARGYEAFLDAQRRLPTRPGGVGWLHWGSQRLLLSELIDAELALGGEEQGARAAFEHVLRAESLGSLARELAPRVTTLDALRGELLAEGRAALVLMPALNGSHAFVLDRAGVLHVPLASRDVLLPLARAFAEEVGRPPPDASRAEAVRERQHRLGETGEALARELFPAALRARISACRELYLCGFDLVDSPPLESLPWSGGRTLGVSLALSHVPSLLVADGLLQRAHGTPPVARGAADDVAARHDANGEAASPAARADGSAPGAHTDTTSPETVSQSESSAVAASPCALAVLVGPAPQGALHARWPELQALSLDEAQRRALLGDVGDTRCVLVTPEHATPSALAALCASASGLLEIFAHGVYDASAERPAALILGPELEHSGLVDIAWIEHLARTPPLVALFACSSARGPARLGDDSSSQLGAAFLARGSSAVLLSRGKLAYGAMLALAREFENALADGACAAEALRRARETLTRDPALADPFYLGQVTLVGLGFEPPPTLPHPSEPAAGPSRLLLVAGASVALALLALLARRALRRQ